jgi:hypothetical protein
MDQGLQPPEFRLPRFQILRQRCQRGSHASLRPAGIVFDFKDMDRRF